MNVADPMRLIRYKLDELGHALKPNGRDRWMTRCPAHDDRNPSLSIATGEDGRVLLHCFAGCSRGAILDALGVASRDLFAADPKPGRPRRAAAQPKAGERPQTAGKAKAYPTADAAIAEAERRVSGECVATWSYRRANGREAFRVLRLETGKGKQYRPLHESPAGWMLADPPGELPLYRLTELPAGDDPVFIVEGEKAADAGASIGLTITTSAHGSKAADRSDWTPLAGRDVVILPDHDEPGRGYADAVAKRLLRLAEPATVRIVELPDLEAGGDLADWLEARDAIEPDELRAELLKLADAVRPIDPASGASSLSTVCLADVESRPLRWLWPGRFPLGKVAMLAGDPGLGKSFITLDIAARVTTGTGWPDRVGEPNEPGRVVLLTAEDDLSDTIRPRLDAAKADVDRITAVKMTRDPDGGDRPFSLTTDLAELGRLLDAMKEARLVIIDPITAYVGGIDSHKNAEVRRVLAPLADLAGRYQAAFLLVNHLNKGVGTNAQYRMSGSLAFVAASRAGWLVQKDASDPERRLMLPAKMNLAKDTTGLAYRLVESDVPGIAVVQWEDGPVEVSADEALAAQDDGGERTDREQAEEFLRELLADGAMPSVTVFRDAKANGFSERTIRRASKAVGVEKRKDGFGRQGGWFWRLPEDQRWPKLTIDGQTADVAKYAGGGQV